MSVATFCQKINAGYNQIGRFFFGSDYWPLKLMTSTPYLTTTNHGQGWLKQEFGELNFN